MLQSITLFGRSINLYDFFNNFSYVGQILVAIFVSRDFVEIATLPKLANMALNKKRKDTFFWRWGFAILLSALMTLIVMGVNNMTGVPITKLFLGTTDANFFPNIFIGPITIFVLCIPLRNSPLKTLDICAPMVAVALVFYKIACFCWGCCYGVESETFGMLNHKTGRVEFPIQLVEAACAVVMLVILLMLVHKKNLKHGILYPLFMLMYCGSRFISEFWRDDYPAVWGKLTGYHIQCILGFIEGAIFLFVVLKWGDRITAYFEAKNEAFLEKYSQKIQAKKRVYQHKKK